MLIEPLQEYSDNSQGILVTWDYSGTSGVVSFRIKRAPSGSQGDPANYTTIDTIDYPTNYYIDPNGTFTSYYIIEEIDDASPTPVIKYTHPYIYAEEALLNADIYWELSQFLNMRCYRDRLFFESSARTTARASMGLWNKTPPPKIEITSSSSDTTEGYQTIERKAGSSALATSAAGNDYPKNLKYDVDYNGRIFFFDKEGAAVAIKPYDEVWATYNFRAISTRNINAALKQALGALLSQPGIGKGFTTVSQVPTRWDRCLISGAAGFLLRQLALQLMVPEPAIFFAMDLRDPSDTFAQVNDRFEKINGKAKEYLDEFTEYKKLIPIEEYPQMLAVVTPEFSLPGGRTRYFRDLFKGSG